MSPVPDILGPYKRKGFKVTRTWSVGPKKSKPEVCPNGLYPFRQSCYDFSAVPVAWPMALNSCTKMGGHLVKIEDSAEDEFLVSQLKKLTRGGSHYGYWIGGQFVGSKWVLADGTQYARWGPGEPDEANMQPYVTMLRPNFTWASHKIAFHKYVFSVLRYICEIPRKL